MLVDAKIDFDVAIGEMHITEVRGYRVAAWEWSVVIYGKGVKGWTKGVGKTFAVALKRAIENFRAKRAS